jgi:uncharacterized protein YcfJ
VATGALVEALESALGGLILEHERLAELAGAQRAAIAAADAAALEGVVREQRERMRAIAVLDARRHEVAGQLAVRYGVGRQQIGSGAGPTISTIAAAVSGAAGERLRALAERLRAVLLGLQREHAVIRSAAETVFAHIDGMMQQLARRVSQTSTYTRPGARAPAVNYASALDLTS